VLRLCGKAQKFFQVRVRDYPWPKGIVAPICVLKAKLGTGVSIEGWKRIGMAAMHTFEGLIETDELFLVVQIVRFAVKCMSRPLSSSDVADLQVYTHTEVRLLI
jgi:hypothetical protein